LPLHSLFVYANVLSSKEPNSLIEEMLFNRNDVLL
jgi:hypothetical protein